MVFVFAFTSAAHFTMPSKIIDFEAPFTDVAFSVSKTKKNIGVQNRGAFRPASHFIW